MNKESLPSRRKALPKRNQSDTGPQKNLRQTWQLFLSMMLIIVSTSIQAQCLVQDFSSTLTTGATAAPGTWYTDRHAPQGFASQSTAPDSRTNTLKQSIASIDVQPDDGRNTQSGSNTQGRAYDLPSGATAMQIDLFIPTSYSTASNRRLAGFWGTAFDAGNQISAYPIIEFTTSSDGTGPRFRGYESGPGTWHDMGLPAGFSYNQWVTLTVQLIGAEFKYTVTTAQGALTYTTTSNGSAASTRIGNVILQGHNLPPAGVDYDIHWDNLVSGTGPFVRNTTTGEAFCSIQSAIDDADTQEGHILLVPAGTYNETVTINKGITLRGAQAGVDPRPSISSTRTIGGAGETIISVTKSQKALNINAANVTIDGFQIEQTGAPGGARAIETDAPHSGIKFTNNIVANTSTGEAMRLHGGEGFSISQNYLSNIAGQAIWFRNGNAASPVAKNQEIINNDIIDVRGTNGGAMNLYGLTDLEISGNRIESTYQGISIGTPLTDPIYTMNDINVHHNTILTALPAGGGAARNAVAISGITSNIQIQNNIIAQSGAATTTYPLIRIGFDADPATLSNPSGVVISNNYLSMVSGGTGKYFDVAANLTNNIQAACNWFGGATSTTAVNALIDDRSSTGFKNGVTFLTSGTNTVASGPGFVPEANACFAPVHNFTKNIYHASIQAALDAATTTNDDEIRVAAGTYNETVTVTKGVKLRGAQAGVDPRPSISSTRTIGGAGETIISVTKSQKALNINAANVIIDGFQIEQTGAPGGARAIETDAPHSGIKFTNNIVANTSTGEAMRLHGGEGFSISQNYLSNIAGQAIWFRNGNAASPVAKNQEIINNDIIDVRGTNGGAMNLYGLTDLEISGNRIESTYQGISIGTPLTDPIYTMNDINVHHNTILTALPAGGGAARNAVAISGITSNIQIQNNIISQSGAATTTYPLIRIGFDADPATLSNPSGVVISNNYLSMVSGGTGKYFDVAVNLTNNIQATCNWFGGASSLSAVNALIDDRSSTGFKNGVTFLTSGTNTVASGPGFVPEANACFAPVQNFTKNIYYATVQAAIDAPTTTNGDEIRIAEGTYNEDFNISKSLTVTGASATTTTIAGPWPGNTKTVIVSAPGVTVKNLTITRQYTTLADWYAIGNKTEGIIVENLNGFTLDNVIVKGNRNGVYIHNVQNFIVKNSDITENRTGFQIWGDLSGGQIINNKITDNFTHGLLVNFDQGPTMAPNLIVKDNYLAGNWYSQVNLQSTGVGVNASNMGSMDISCNYFGPTVTYTEDPIGGQSYDTQVPKQFGGTNQNALPAYTLGGRNASLIQINSYRTAGNLNPGVGNTPVGSCYSPVRNVTQSKGSLFIQRAISGAASNDSIAIDPGTYNEVLTIDKNLVFGGAGAVAGCASTPRPAAETILNGPATGVLINIGGTSTATFNGFLFKTDGLANVSAAGQNLTIRNSIIEFTFKPGSNNLYFASNALTLECNEFKAKSGTNDGSSSHIFFAGASSLIRNNSFTSVDARASMSNTTQSLPVWINLTSGANNTSVRNNTFTKVDIGMLLASTIGNVNIEQNDFLEAKRESLPFGSGMGAGIALFQDITPTAPVVVRYNRFANSETGIRTSGSGTNFPASDLLSINYNAFETMSDKAIRIGASYASASNRLNALCNWFGAITGPSISTNDGAAGQQILDGNSKVAFKNWLVYGDANNSLPGLQLPATVTVAPGNNASVAENHYRILSNAIGCAASEQTISLSGVFDLANATAQGEWAKGNDGIAQGMTPALAQGSGDDYTILAPAGRANVKLTATTLGSATINGPGDLASVSLESFLFFNSNNANATFKDWEVSNLVVNNFDASITADHNGGSTVAMENFKLLNNEINIPVDLNASTESTIDFQNIGIHLNFGKNQLISGNKIVMNGTGVSNGTTSYSTSVALQSATAGGDIYDGLRIENNNIHVTGTPNADAARIVGIWENSNNQTAAIKIIGNKLVNDNPANLASANRQLGFRVTSHSGGGKQVIYENNEVTGFNRGIDWIGDPFSQYTAVDYAATSEPVIVRNNKFDLVKYGVTVRKAATSANGGSPTVITNNGFTRIAENGFAVSNESGGTTDAKCNWYDAAIVSAVINGSVTFNPKLSNGNDNSTDAGFQLDAANSCLFPVINETAGGDFPTIQEAINAAGTGNVIRVNAGIYPENVMVNKSVTIYGADSSLVIIDKGNYDGNAGNGFDVTANDVTLKTMKVTNYNNGVTNTTAISNLKLESLSLVSNFGAGFLSNKGINGLSITKSNLNNNGNKNGTVSASGIKRGIFIQGSEEDYSGIVIEENIVNANGLAGIDVNLSKSLNGVTIHNNQAKRNADAQISLWLGKTTPTSAAAIVSENTLELTGGARYGIEVKNPNGNGRDNGTGSVVVKNNIISVNAGLHNGSDRDMAAIAVIRRKDDSNTINDQPQGVVVIGNTISNFQNALAGDGYGITFGGTGHRVATNTISNTEFSIQLQKGNTGFDGDVNSPSNSGQTNTEYFDRDNSADVCVEFGTNTITTSGAPRLVTAAGTTSATMPEIRLINTDLGTKFCTIQQGIDFAATVNTHTLKTDAGTFVENVRVTKELKLIGAKTGASAVTREAAFTGGKASPAVESIITTPTNDPSGTTPGNFLVRVLANNVTIDGFVFDGNNGALPASALSLNGVGLHARRAITNEITTTTFAEIQGLQIKNNIAQNFSQRAISLHRGSGVSSGNSIDANVIQNVKDAATILYTNFYADVTNNTIKVPADAIGVHLQNFSTAGAMSWTGNTISVGLEGIGMHVNLFYGPGSSLTVANNTLTSTSASDADLTWGINVWSVSNSVNVALNNNTIGATGAKFGRGINLWNLNTTSPVTITGGTINNSLIGINNDNIDAYYGNGDNTTVNVSGTTITSQGVGVRARTAALTTPPSAGGTNVPSANVMINLNDVDVIATGANTAVSVVSPAAAGAFGATVKLAGGTTITGGSTTPVLIDGSNAKLILADAAVTAPASGSNNAIQFANMTAAGTFSNLVINSGTTINLNGNTSARAFESPNFSIVEVAGNWANPDSLSGGVRPVKIDGSMRFTDGILTTGNSIMEFGTNATDIMTGSAPEKAASHIIGRIMMLSRVVDNAAIDMLGVKLDAQGGSGGDLDNLVIMRTTKTSGGISPAFGGDASIRTVWQISPSKAGASRGNAQFRYLNTAENVNGQIPTGIFAYRYNTGNSSWEKKSAERGSDLSGDIYTTESFGIVEFSSWTLSSGSTSPDLVPFILFNNIQFTASQTTRPFVATIYNDRSANPTSGPITIRIYRPTLASTIALTGSSVSEWTVTEPAANYYLLTATNPLVITTQKTISAELTVPGSTATGNYNVRVLIPDLIGGEVEGDNGNNETLGFITKN